MTQFQENTWTDRRMDGRIDGRADGWKDRLKDGQTLFHRTVPANAEGPIKIAGSVRPSRR